MSDFFKDYRYVFVEFEPNLDVGSLLNLTNQVKVLTPYNKLVSIDADSPKLKAFSTLGVIGYDLKPFCKLLKEQFGVKPKAVFDTKIVKKLLNQQDTKDSLLQLPQVFKQLAQKLNEETGSIKASGVSKKVFDVVNPVAAIEFGLIPNLADIELNGVPIDVKSLQELLKKYQSIYQNAYMNFKQNYGVDPFSPSQLKDFFHKLGIDTSQDGLLKEKFLEKYKHIDAVSELLKLRQVKKLLNKLEELDRYKKGERVFPTFKQIAAPTGRMATVEPNIQNLPSQIKHVIKAPEGKTFIIADYSQIELRILAEYVDEPKMINAFKKGLDLHRYTASLILNKKYEEINQRERTLAKAINFGLVYGMSVSSLHEYVKNNYGINVPLSQIKQLYNRFFDTFSSIKDWHQNIKESLQREGNIKVYSILGRSRRISRFTDAVNYPIQATGSDLLKLAVNLFYKKKKGLDANIINLVHDEILVETSLEDVETAKEVLKQSMEEAGRYILKKVPVEFDIKISKVWEK